MNSETTEKKFLDIESSVDEFIVNDLIIIKKCLPIIDDYVKNRCIHSLGFPSVFLLLSNMQTACLCFSYIITNTEKIGGGERVMLCKRLDSYDILYHCCIVSYHLPLWENFFLSRQESPLLKRG